MNLQVVIELLLKNKKELDAILSSLKEKHGIDIDTAAADSAMGDLQASVEGISDSETVIDADASGAIDAADEAEAEIEEIPEEHETEISATDNTTSIITAISTGYMALMQVIGKVKGKIDEMINLSGIQEKSEKLLQVSLANTGDATQATFEKFKNLAASYQEVTTIGDETTIGVMKLGLNMGVMAEDLEEATKGAIGLSKSLDLDLKTAMKMHTLAMDKDYTMLQRYLPSLKTAKDEAEKMAIVKRAEANGWKLATSEVDTGYGALEQYNNLAGDVKEKIGNLITIALLPFLEILSTGTIKIESFFRGLTETSLETTIREMRELGVNIEIIQRLKKLQLKTEIIELNAELDKVNSKFDTTEELIGEIESIEEKLSFQAALYADAKADAAENALNERGAAADALNTYEGIATLSEKEVELLQEKLIDYAEELNIITAIETKQTQIKTLNEEIEPATVIDPEEIEHVDKLSDELQKLADSVPKINIKLDTDELTNEDGDEAFLAEMEREREHLEELIGLKMEFGERGDELNLTRYEQQMLAIDEFYGYNKDKLIESGLTEEQIVDQTEKSKDRIRSQYNKRAISGASGMFGNLAKVMKAQGKSGFEAYKVMATSQAMIDTYKSANSAYSALAGIPVIGPILGAAAAAAAIAAGIVNVQSIGKQKFATGGVVEEETEAIIGEEGPEAVVPLPDGKSIPVKGVGGDSKVLSAILVELKAMNVNIVRQNKNITFVIETTDPEATVKLLNETGDRMTEANDVN